MKTTARRTNLVLTILLLASLASLAAVAAEAPFTIEPAKPSTVSFDSVSAKFVRMMIRGKGAGQPCIDELEVYGPESDKNLALAAAGAEASASSCLEGYAAHAVAHLNDGQYGNARSWIPAETSGWAQIELPRAVVVNRVVFSRDREGNYEDRLPSALEVHVSDDGKAWQTVRKIEIARIVLAEPTYMATNEPITLEFSPCEARHVRLAINKTSFGQRQARTVFKAGTGHMIQHPELHFDADRLMFSMADADGAFQVFEVRIDGSGLRQVTRDTDPDVDNGDPCYLPNGRILFNSTRLFTGVPCEDGESYVSNLCLTNADGSGTRLLTFDQESCWHPSMLNDGRVLYTRYEYANISHQFARLLFHMNPDGTTQMEYYGSNSYWPNSIFYARAIPNHPTRVVGVVCGHHGPNKTGRLVLFDPALGRHETSGAIQTIPGYRKPVQRIVEDLLYAGDWPKFAHPWPLNDKYFLVAARLHPEQLDYGIYLVDVFDTITEVARVEGHSLLEPIPLAPRPVPPAIPDRVRPERKDATVYLVDVYHGPGLAGVPRGTVKKLRVFTYNYVYRHTSRRGFGHLATPGIDGPWEPRFLLGTVPVRDDGSALFTVPANTPLTVQPLDDQGRAVQQMRSWFTAMPGEVLSCVGCHERQNSGSPAYAAMTSLGKPATIEPWRGPPRGFDFAREVQPVLDRYCVGCHNGKEPDRLDLVRKSEEEKLRINPEYRAATESTISTILTPSYIALHPYVRRPHAESHYGAQAAGEFLVDTSPLVQMLQRGHHEVQLDTEAWDRLYTWIDLGAPDHGSWKYSEWGVPRDYYERRLESLRQFAGRTDDVEWMPEDESPAPAFVAPPEEKTAAEPAPTCPGWPFDAAEAQRKQQAVGLPATLSLKLNEKLAIELILIPPGEFVLGDAAGRSNERPATRVRIDRPFYLGRTEVTNAQYGAVTDGAHHSGFVSWMSIDWRGEGHPLNGPDQPAVRVSWQEAERFCEALAARIGRRITLPTEAQWEWACRAGAAGGAWYGGRDDDFSAFENLAGRELRTLAFHGKPKWFLRDDRFQDAWPVTAPAGSTQPNPWGLCDMFGNVREWTRSSYRPYPYDPAMDVPSTDAADEKTVRGGSWATRPSDAGSAWRWKYPAWRKVHDVGFRVVASSDSSGEEVARVRTQ
ncbi:MAG TPA: SUMF1/EgtB/PvdO family nonheme iron enzyme [Thermoguttaceae bacterium]|nr:SUMF1/EgtB/PvdO family nonheme iron enzyme [Thermoguttaceae bacterium]HUU94701.1 SUMF1/EgtB/PvdO family nonheme iron enzyme [Phycisphaerae bacterium]